MTPPSTSSTRPAAGAPAPAAAAAMHRAGRPSSLTAPTPGSPLQPGEAQACQRSARSRWVLRNRVLGGFLNWVLACKPCMHAAAQAALALERVPCATQPRQFSLTAALHVFPALLCALCPAGRWRWPASRSSPPLATRGGAAAAAVGGTTTTRQCTTRTTGAPGTPMSAAMQVGAATLVWVLLFNGRVLREIGVGAACRSCDLRR